MEVVALIEFAVILLLFWRREREREQNAQLLAEFSREWADERALLVNKVTHPQMVFPANVPPPARPYNPPDADEYASIGTVSLLHPPDDGDHTA